jgi:hypothetical protein
MAKKKLFGNDKVFVQYLPVNQAYAIMLYGNVHRIFNSKSDAENEVRRILNSPVKWSD